MANIEQNPSPRQDPGPDSGSGATAGPRPKGKTHAATGKHIDEVRTPAISDLTPGTAPKPVDPALIQRLSRAAWEAPRVDPAQVQGRIEAQERAFARFREGVTRDKLPTDAQVHSMWIMVSYGEHNQEAQRILAQYLRAARAQGSRHVEPMVDVVPPDPDLAESGYTRLVIACPDRQSHNLIGAALDEARRMYPNRYAHLWHES